MIQKCFVSKKKTLNLLIGYAPLWTTSAQIPVLHTGQSSVLIIWSQTCKICQFPLHATQRVQFSWLLSFRSPVSCSNVNFNCVQHTHTHNAVQLITSLLTVIQACFDTNIWPYILSVCCSYFNRQCTPPNY